MASQCKRQQCTIDRRGFRQELDSWRHKLIHCVGFESILEGLFTPELVEDLQIFKDCEPTAVSDWSFDETCLFCCFRRDKVKEHLIGLSSDGLEDTKSVLVKDQSAISRLEKQAEEFLHAVLSRKDVPNFSDPNIPIVAREILQRMIRQFAAEYTSKTSGSAQDPQPCSDRSLPTTPSPSGAKPPSSSPPGTPAGPATHSQAGTPKHNQAGTPAAHSLNPVLSKLLMADQDAPLDLTIKKPPPLPSDQDGVLDLSIKKSRSLSARSPCLSPAPAALKGESSDLAVTRAKDLQSTSTLEQFMAKLCPHHQRQIVDAIGFLQTEVKALTSSNTQQDPNSSTGDHGTARSKAKSSVVTPEKSDPRLKFPSESTFKSEVQDMSCSTPSSCAVKKVPESPVSIKTSVSAGPGLDLRSPGSASNPSLHSPTAQQVDAENKHHGDHAPLKIKIMTSNVAAGKKLSCVLNTSLSSLSDPSEDREAMSNSPSKTETHSARLSSSVKRHNQPAHTNQARQRGTPGHAKDPQAKLFSVHVTIPSDSPRTARKTIRGSSDHRIGDSSCRVMADPDLGHCDIVFIDKPITECFKEQRHKMVPRRNARKSTRGHMYSDEIWELKTVRTLAGRGNCPNPMPELITLVTPKQILSKPEGVPPPVDMPVAVACGDTVNQPMATEESNVSIIPGTGDMVETAASEVDVVVETSQTDQCHNKAQSVCPSPIRSPTENKETDLDTHVEQETVEDSRTTAEDSRTTTEDSRTTAEDSRTTTEDSRTTTEDSRTTAEDSRTTTEDSRTTVEDSRTTTEDSRTTTEDSRTTAEDSRTTTEDSRTTTEDSRTTVEDSRTTAEDSRTTTEDSRTTAEDSRTTAEDSRTTTEDSRTTVEDSRTTVEDSRTTAEDSRTTAEDSRTTTEDSRTTVEDSGTTVADSETTTTGSEESVGQAPLEAEKDHEPQTEPQEDIPESTEQLMAEPIVEPIVEPLENVATVVAETQLSSETLDSEPIPEQNRSPSPVNQVEEEENHMEETPEEQHQVEEHQKEEHEVEEHQEKGNQIEEDQIEENQKEEMQDEHPQEPLPEMQIDCENLEVTEKSDTTGPAEEVVVKEPEAKTSEVADSVMPEDENDTDYDVTTKSLDALLKELPPWRRKRGTVILLPKRLRQTETTVVGFVNGRPISASDRSLRRRSSNSATSPGKAPFKSRKKTSVDSTVENKNVEKNLDQTQIQSAETTPVIVKVEDPSSSSATPSSLEFKSPLKTKQTRKQKRVQTDRDGLPVPSDQSTGPKRQLRSAGQQPAVTPHSSNAVSSISSPKPTTTHALPATERQISPTDTSALPASSSPVRSDPSAQSQQNIVPETSMELTIDQNQSLEKTSEEVKKNEIESALLAKQELRSTKAVADESKNETKQPSNEVSSLLESQSPVKTEVQTQVLPLRSKRVLQKELEASDVSLLQKPNSASSEDGAAGGYESSSGSLISDKRKRMPLRSESSKSEMSASKSPPSKLALRSQRLAGPSTSAGTVAGRPIDASSPVRIKQERVTKAQARSPPASVLPHNSGLPMITPRPEPPKQMPNKFFQNLTAEENQHRITNLNIKFDKMQKGWVQMDKEGQPATKYKNKSDRQAAIWKSKRRARKSKSLEHQKYSPVQMLFMKGFNLTSICRWFLESTETKSLVIVKKVNTRLPSETQLCFHSSSSAGTSQGVFPSLQAERLKKHLKKFAIASPVKSNPKSQKLLAKALEQMGNTGKGKEKRELLSTTAQTLIQSDLSAEACVQKGESQKSSGKSKNPASARILRKYSNIRENVRLKEASTSLKTNSVKRVAPTKSAAKSNLKPSLKAKKSHLPKSLVKKQIKQSAAKMEGRKTHKNAKRPVLGRPAKAQSNGKASKDTTKKTLPKRSSQRQQQHNPAADTSKSKTNNKKQMEAEKVEVERPSVNRMNASKTQAKEAPQGTVAAEIKGAENAVETPQPGTDAKVPTSPDQVLTRSQRKIDAAVPSNGGPKGKRKYTKSIKKELASPKSGKEVKKAEEPKLTRSGSLKTPVKRNQAAVSSPRIATKSATKRARELLQTPAKRTRTSLAK